MNACAQAAPWTMAPCELLLALLPSKRRSGRPIQEGQFMEIRRLIVGTTLLLLFALLRRRTFESTSSPPAASPPSPLRLTFGVRRRRRAERAQQLRRKHAGSTAAFEQISSKHASLPPASAEPPPPPPTDFTLGSSTRLNSACALNGRESGPGCHHNPCLLGVCICGDGSGGETCERGGQRIFNRSCHAAEELAYGGAQSDGLTRHAHHDVCAFYEPAYGIMRVDERRWKFAQLWEASLWSVAPASQTTDRNAHHALQFDQYRALPDALGHVLEIGSGPYTQTQSLLLRPGSSTSSITLVDPLARVYMDRTKGCTYKEQRLHGRPVRILNVPAESLSLVHAADTLVMVSVLQSVRDVPAVLQVSVPPECV